MISRLTRSIRSLIALLLLSSLLTIPYVQSQEPDPSPTTSPSTSAVDKVALHQALLDLTNSWTVMCVAAHPDDEDGTTLTVLRRKYGVHTVSLFSTFGEGGQNAIGPELYEELGVIRADETARAASIQGSEPYFLGLKDFGFSKTADEAFRFWGHDEALRRMVQNIRQLRPDVIITNHDTTSGHGHHQATGRLVLEAFEAAADPQRFPEQLTRVQIWQVKRLFVRYRRPSSETANPDEQLVIVDPNEVDPVRGVSFGEQALMALQQHASQGPWPANVSVWLRAQNNQTGKLNLIRYRLVKEAQATPALPEGGTSVPFIAGLQLPDDVAKHLTPPAVVSAELMSTTADTETMLQALIDWRKSVPRSSQNNPEQPRVALFDSRLDKALQIATGLKLSFNSKSSVLVPGLTTPLTVSLANEGNRIVSVHNLTLSGWNEKQQLDAAEHILPDTETTITVDLTTPKNATFTVPKSEHLYDGRFKGKAVVTTAEVEVEGGARFTAASERDFDVAPAVELAAVTPNPYVWTPGSTDKPMTFEVQLKNNTVEEFRGFVKISSPSYRVFEFGKNISLPPLQSQSVRLQVNATLTLRNRRRVPVSRSATLSVERTGSAELVTQREVPVIHIDARVLPNLRVGYIPSFDRTLETALAALGVEATSLSMDDVKSGDLTGFRAIIIDNRGYEAHPELVTNNERLLQYVNDGGTLLVFYHKDNEWNPDERKGRPQLAPYLILLGGERVTEEDAAVHFRMPSHRLLNYPNKITQNDFLNWIQERGLYYPKEWDPKYSMLFSMRDTGEKPLYGGLLVVRYGRGNYIYTSMVWYRQLRAGVSGGYRMLANMISYGR
jgi:LmbE family N-acetylglucosaminyl deacetylase